MNRQLTAEISESDDADMLVNELVLYGFVKEVGVYSFTRRPFHSRFTLNDAPSLQDDYVELAKMVRETLQTALVKNTASESPTPSDFSPRLESGSKAPVPVPEPQS